MGLKLTRKKIVDGELSKKAADFLGITVSNRKISISSAQVARVEHQLNDLFYGIEEFQKIMIRGIHYIRNRIGSSVLC